MFNPKLRKRLKKENQLLSREYHMKKLYYGMVKGAYEFMDKKHQQEWLKLNKPDKEDGCISLFYGSTDWFTDI